MTTTLLVTIITETCFKCGIPFGIEARFQKERINDHGTFYCPNGHGQHYLGETEAQRLAKELAAAKRREGWARDSAQSWKDQAETAEARRRAEKGAKTKLRNRIANGVCPCCKRSFMDLRRHISGQHPDFPAAD